MNRVNEPAIDILLLGIQRRRAAGVERIPAGVLDSRPFCPHGWDDQCDQARNRMNRARQKIRHHLAAYQRTRLVSERVAVRTWRQELAEAEALYHQYMAFVYNGWHRQDGGTYFEVARRRWKRYLLHRAYKPRKPNGSDHLGRRSPC